MVVSNPTDKVFQEAVLAESPRVENLLNFPLLLVVDNDRRGLGLGSKLGRQRVRGGGFEERDVENWVNLHRIGKIQLISVGGAPDGS
jgi:hypothetical protein